MAKEENLKNGIKFSNTDDEAMKKNHNASECGKKGGIASRESRKRKIIYKEIFEHITKVKLSKENHIQELKELYPEVTEDEMNYGVLSAFRILEKSLSGSTKAFEIVRDTMGQAPVQKQEITNIDQDGYRKVLIGDEDIFAGDYGSADESDEEEEDKKE